MGLAAIVGAARAGGQLPDRCNPDTAAAVLAAVVDGLTLHGIAHPGQDLAGTLQAAAVALLR